MCGPLGGSSLERLDSAIERLDIPELVSICSNSDGALAVATRLENRGILEESVSALYCSIALAERLTDRKMKAGFFNDASLILTIGMAFLGDSYGLAFHFAYQAIECDPDNIRRKESILQTYCDIPDFKMPEEVKRSIVAQIIAIDPQNAIAARYM
jgi:hypothetical protein